MSNYTKEFLNLTEYFKEIDVFQKGSTIDVDKIAKMFYFELANININYQTTGKCLLARQEHEYVQQFINIITGNRNVSKAIRRKIIEEALDFNEMVEIFKRQSKYSVDLRK